MIKTIIGIIIFLVAASVVGMLLPAIIGIYIGIVMIQAGKVVGGLAAILIGIGINVAMVAGSWLEGDSGSGSGSGSGFGSDSEDITCPYCGSDDTDGNHCYNCDEDY